MHLIQPNYSLLWGTNYSLDTQMPLGDIALSYRSIFQSKYPHIREGIVSQIPHSYFFLFFNLLQTHTLTLQHPLLKKSKDTYPKAKFKNLNSFTHLIPTVSNISTSQSNPLHKYLKSLSPTTVDPPSLYPSDTPRFSQFIFSSVDAHLFQDFFTWISTQDPDQRFSLCQSLLALETTNSNSASFTSSLATITRITPEQFQGILFGLALSARLFCKRPDISMSTFFKSESTATTLSLRLLDLLSPHLSTLPAILQSTLVTSTFFHSNDLILQRLSHFIEPPESADLFFSNPLHFGLKKFFHSIDEIHSSQYVAPSSHQFFSHTLPVRSELSSSFCIDYLLNSLNFDHLLFTPTSPDQDSYTLDILFHDFYYPKMISSLIHSLSSSKRFSNFLIDHDFSPDLQKNITQYLEKSVTTNPISSRLMAHFERAILQLQSSDHSRGVSRSLRL